MVFGQALILAPTIGTAHRESERPEEKLRVENHNPGDSRGCPVGGNRDFTCVFNGKIQKVRKCFLARQVQLFCHRGGSAVGAVQNSFFEVVYVMRAFFLLRRVFAPVLFLMGVVVALLGLVADAPAQQLTFGKHTVSLASLDHFGDRSPVTQNQVNRLRNHPKTSSLLSQARSVLGGDVRLGSRAITVRIADVIHTAGSPVPAPLNVTLTFVDLETSRGNRRSGALMFCMQDDFPELAFPRLMTKEFPGDSLVSEYALRFNGRNTLMTARFGDCVFRSAEQIIGNRAPAAHRVLRNRIEDLRHASCFDMLIQLYGPQGRTVGGPILAMVSAALVPAQYEEEYHAAFVDATIERLKPERSDPIHIRLMKEALKALLKELVKHLGKLIMSWF